MAQVPPDLAWSEEDRSHGSNVELRRSRTAAVVLLVVALGILTWGVAHIVSLLSVSDELYELRRRSHWQPRDFGAFDKALTTAAVVCFVIAWRAIARLRDVPRMRVARTGFTLTGSFLLPTRVGFELGLAEIAKFEPLPAGFSTDVIPLGGGWDVAVVTRSGPRRRLRLPLDDLVQAQFVANRLNHLVNANRGS